MSHNDPVHPATKMLAAVADFATLDEATLETLARVAIRRAYEGNQVVFSEGETGLGLYIVETGWFKAIKISPDGREQVIHFLGPGEPFNALSVFTETSNHATVIAMEPSVAWLIRRAEMLRVCVENHRGFQDVSSLALYVSSTVLCVMICSCLLDLHGPFPPLITKIRQKLWQSQSIAAIMALC